MQNIKEEFPFRGTEIAARLTSADHMKKTHALTSKARKLLMKSGWEQGPISKLFNSIDEEHRVQRK
jgi:hypothetical protein